MQPELEQGYIEQIRKYLVDVRRTRLSQLQRDGIISVPTYESLSAQLDEEAIRLKRGSDDL